MSSSAISIYATGVPETVEVMAAPAGFGSYRIEPDSRIIKLVGRDGSATSLWEQRVVNRCQTKRVSGKWQPDVARELPTPGGPE